MKIQRGDGAIVARLGFNQPADGGSHPTSPLQFMFREIPMRLAQQLNESWHSMLPRTDL